MKRNLAAFQAFLAILIRADVPRYQPTRPSIISVVERLAPVGKAGKKKRASFIMVERLIDNTRYPGEALRQIRKNGQARECARRLARGCIQ